MPRHADNLQVSALRFFASAVQNGKRGSMIRSRLLYISLILALIGDAVLLRYVDPFFVRALRLAASDNFQLLAPEPYHPNLPIRIVDIDENHRSVAMATKHRPWFAASADISGRGCGRL
jgi:CHASE2 domain-containing sensor protein